MIEIGKKYRLKKLKDWFEKDSEEFTVVCFGEPNIVGCVAPDGERYVFDKPNTCTYTTKNSGRDWNGTWTFSQNFILLEEGIQLG